MIFGHTLYAIVFAYANPSVENVPFRRNNFIPFVRAAPAIN